MCLRSVLYFILYTGASHIEKMLKANRVLQYLDISRNEIDDDGVKYVARGLQENETMTEISLENCEISVTGTKI